jgi:hypothetical protein
MVIEAEGSMTENQAIQYVLDTEMSWGFDSAIVESAPYLSDDGTFLVRVVTSNGNVWDVWQQLDGTIYGEC